MKTKVELITPEYAKQLLERNTMNRLIKKQLLLDYVRQMRNGLWKEDTGEAIKIGNDGTILDGQHRLLALIDAKVSLNFLVISGLEKDVFSVLDSGAKRSAGDVLHISGVNSAKTLAGGIKLYMLLTLGKVLTFRSGYISSSEILTLYSKRSKFWDAAIKMSLGWYHDSKRLLTPADFIAVYARFFDIDEDDAFLFMEALSKGDNLSSNDPIYALRGKLMFAKMNPKFTLLPSIRTAYIFKAWNAFRNNAKMKVLTFNPEKDHYPMPR